MRITEKVERTVEETLDVLCNRCGDSCKQYTEFIGLIEARVRGGYLSTHLEDNKDYVFSFCEKCLMELFSYFRHPPT